MEEVVPRMLIVGPGALGSLLAAFLIRAGLSPILLDHNPARAALINQQGLIVEDAGVPGSANRALPVRALADPALVGPVELIILTVKTPALPSLLPSLRPLCTMRTLLLAFENGIIHPPLLAQAKLPGAWGLGVTSLGATLTGPGRVRFGGSGLTALGCLPEERVPWVEKRLAQTAAFLGRAGFEVAVIPDIEVRLWAKLLINVGINALTAIHRCPNGGLLERPEALADLKAAVLEAAAVAKAKGIRIDGDPVAQTLAVCRATADNISSMLQDIRQGRGTEIEAINGAVVREAELLGIAVPVNRRLVRKVLSAETSRPPCPLNSTQKQL